MIIHASSTSGSPIRSDFGTDGFDHQTLTPPPSSPSRAIYLLLRCHPPNVRDQSTSGSSLDRNFLYNPSQKQKHQEGSSTHRKGAVAGSTIHFSRSFVTLTTASATGIHVAVSTSRARTQVIRRTKRTSDRETLRLVSPLVIVDVAAALGRIVPAWGPSLCLLLLRTIPRALSPFCAGLTTPEEKGATEYFSSYLKVRQTCGSRRYIALENRAAKLRRRRRPACRRTACRRARQTARLARPLDRSSLHTDGRDTQGRPEGGGGGACFSRLFFLFSALSLFLPLCLLPSPSSPSSLALTWMSPFSFSLPISRAVCILARSSDSRGLPDTGPALPRPAHGSKFRKLGLARAGSSEPARPTPVCFLAAAQQSSCDARPRERALGLRATLHHLLLHLLLLFRDFLFLLLLLSLVISSFVPPTNPGETVLCVTPLLPLLHSLARFSSSSASSVFFFFFFFLLPLPVTRNPSSTEGNSRQETPRSPSQERE